MVYGGSEPTLNQNGMIELAAYPDCVEPHDSDETMYVVGVGTPHESVFPSSRSKYAYAFSRSHAPPLRITKAYANQLCSQAVLDAYAAAM